MFGLKYKNTLVFALLLLLCGNVYSSCTQTGNKVDGLLGMDNGNGKIYIKVSSPSKQCGCSDFRFQPENTDTSMVLSIALAAKMADESFRVDIMEEGNCRSAYKIYIE